ncbi:10481_t:CDS:1, partial [Gigaspora rosea]
GKSPKTYLVKEDQEESKTRILCKAWNTSRPTGIKDEDSQVE